MRVRPTRQPSFHVRALHAGLNEPSLPKTFMGHDDAREARRTLDRGTAGAEKGDARGDRNALTGHMWWRPATRFKEVFAVIRWNASFFRVAVAIAAFASLAIASGAGARWY